MSMQEIINLKCIHVIANIAMHQVEFHTKTHLTNINPSTTVTAIWQFNVIHVAIHQTSSDPQVQLVF